MFDTCEGNMSIVLEIYPLIVHKVVYRNLIALSVYILNLNQIFTVLLQFSIY